MEALVIHGGKPLTGTVEISGAKNAAVAIIPAALVSDGICVIDNIPEKNRKNILIIGDSQSSDILGGINSGIDTCWYNPKGEIPKYNSQFIINSLDEIKNIL